MMADTDASGRDVEQRRIELRLMARQHERDTQRLFQLEQVCTTLGRERRFWRRWAWSVSSAWIVVELWRWLR